MHVHLIIQLTLKGKGDLNEAIKYHYKALKISPYNPVIHSNLANTKLEAGGGWRKISYEKALELAPNLLYANRGMSSVMHEQKYRPIN